VGGITTAYRLDPKVVVGAGLFASGGTDTKLTGVNTFGVSNGTNQSQLSILDFTVGAATSVTPEFSLGLAWRLTYAMGEIQSAIPALGQLSLTSLSAMDANSFRLGAQYKTDKFGVGLNIRTPVELSLKGNSEISQSLIPGGDGSYSGVKASATFPFQIALGTNINLTPKWTLFTEGSWTNYSVDQKLNINDPSQGSNNAAKAVADNGILLKWRDMWVGRLGAQYQMRDWLAFRAGYVFTSQVTSSKYARATFTAPGAGHTICIGSGFKFGKIDADLAADYSFVRGYGQNLTDTTITDDHLYKTDAITVHLGVAYNY